jgi:DNA replication protein DnaC
MIKINKELKRNEIAWISFLEDETRHYTLDHCKDLPHRLLDDLCEALIVKNKSLYLFGTWGSGKTCVAFALIREIMSVKDCYYWPKYITAKKLDSLLLAASRADGDTWEVEKYATADLLFIDDLDKVSGTDRFKNQLFEILNTRYQRSLPTIITSNARPQELGLIMDGAILSRMSDSQKWGMFRFPNKDLRPTKKLILKELGYDEIGNSGVENSKDILGEGTS